MPNTRSALKRTRSDRKRRLRNQGAYSELKTLVVKFRRFLREGKAPQAKELFPLLVKRLDQARSKRILHKNTVSRKKARLSLQLAKAL